MNSTSMNSVTLSEWRTPATAYPRKRVGRAEIESTRYPRGTYHCYMQRGYEYFRAARPLTITALSIDGKTWMVDDPPHWWAMEEHALAYRGHVVCAGLGLGLIVHTLNDNPAVDRITVIERERDVIDLVSPHVPHDKLAIRHGDFYEIDAHDFQPVNGVLFDLYVGDARELMGAAIRESSKILDRWARPGDDDFVVRIHGLPNPWLQEAAEELRGYYERTGGGRV